MPVKSLADKNAFVELQSIEVRFVHVTQVSLIMVEKIEILNNKSKTLFVQLILLQPSESRFMSPANNVIC